MRAADVESLPDWKRCVAVVFDEVRVKEGIVYDKHNCRVVGFVDLGEVNNALLSFERSAHQNSDFPMAKHILMFFVRGIFIGLKFPYAQFPTRDLSAEVLYPIVWEVLNVLDSRWYH